MWCLSFWVNIIYCLKITRLVAKFSWNLFNLEPFPKPCCHASFISLLWINLISIWWLIQINNHVIGNDSSNSSIWCSREFEQFLSFSNGKKASSWGLKIFTSHSFILSVLFLPNNYPRASTCWKKRMCAGMMMCLMFSSLWAATYQSGTALEKTFKEDKLSTRYTPDLEFF